MDPEQVWRSLYGTPEPAPAGPETSEASGARAPVGDRVGVAGGPIRRMLGSDQSTSGRVGPDVTPRRVVQMHNLYLVAEMEDGIIIVDQHALHERILYEQLRSRITKGALESQRLLLPETLSVTGQEAALLETHTGLLVRLGIEMTPFGTDAIAVQAFPALLKDTDVVSFMRDLIDRLTQQEGTTPPDAVIDNILSMMACKAAVKAGDPLTPEEIDALFKQRQLADKSSSCPHGRPTMLRLTKADLDRQFHRT